MSAPQNHAFALAKGRGDFVGIVKSPILEHFQITRASRPEDQNLGRLRMELSRDAVQPLASDCHSYAIPAPLKNQRLERLVVSRSKIFRGAVERKFVDHKKAVAQRPFSSPKEFDGEVTAIAPIANGRNHTSTARTIIIRQICESVLVTDSAAYLREVFMKIENQDARLGLLRPMLEPIGLAETAHSGDQNQLSLIGRAVGYLAHRALRRHWPAKQRGRNDLVRVEHRSSEPRPEGRESVLAVSWPPGVQRAT